MLVSRHARCTRRGSFLLSAMLPLVVLSVAVLLLCTHIPLVAAEREAGAQAEEEVRYIKAADLSPAELSTEEHAAICENTITGAGLGEGTDRTYTGILTSRSPSCASPPLSSNGRVLVVAPHTAAVLIKIQKHALDLFLREPFNYVVYDDSVDTGVYSTRRVCVLLCVCAYAYVVGRL